MATALAVGLTQGRNDAGRLAGEDRVRAGVGHQRSGAVDRSHADHARVADRHSRREPPSWALFSSFVGPANARPST
ncbi:hypothetical protein ACFY1S_00535 [Micromonospora sp. NPDC000663]|uniref:hypothetical protein n=1 Tax=Micromonospora sp. NPDC000663 TaxID=3364218 RepID=UPI00369535F5